MMLALFAGAVPFFLAALERLLPEVAKAGREVRASARGPDGKPAGPAPDTGEDAAPDGESDEADRM